MIIRRRPSTVDSDGSSTLADSGVGAMSAVFGSPGMVECVLEPSGGWVDEEFFVMLVSIDVPVVVGSE